jgi:hypothetical protein
LLTLTRVDMTCTLQREKLSKLSDLLSGANVCMSGAWPLHAVRQPTTSRPPFDFEASQAVAKSTAERTHIPPTAEGRTWTRNDIYEDRLGRFSR